MIGADGWIPPPPERPPGAPTYVADLIRFLGQCQPGARVYVNHLTGSRALHVQRWDELPGGDVVIVLADGRVP